MTKDDILAELSAHRLEFEALGVAHLVLFGSFARGDTTEMSDIDLVADYQPGATPGLKVVQLHRRLEEILNRPVDLLRGPVQNPILQQRIQSEGLYAF